MAAVAGSVGAGALAALARPRAAKITRAVGFFLPTKRSKIAGKNSRLGVHGDTSRDRMVRLYTDTGVEGLGNCRAPRRDVEKLLGRNPFEQFDQKRNAFTGLGAGTMPLWDLAGKLLKKPVYELLGGKGPQQAPCYDGSIYFADLLPQYAAKWQDRFRQEIDMGLKLGHRAFKIKIGRGAKWMPRKAGDDRDVEVVKIVRKHAGKDVLLGVDANNGYDLAGAKHFIERAAETDIAFAEEMFPETVDDCLAFKAFFKKHGLQTLLADGETQGKLEVFKPFIARRAIDVYQADMNRFGFEGILTEAKWAAERKLLVAPHNWGSLIGFYMQLHVGRAITNFYRAEHDPLTAEGLIADGYKIAKGKASVPAAPGFGLKIDEDAFKRMKIAFDVKA